jgi:hypothetical protein
MAILQQATNVLLAALDLTKCHQIFLYRSRSEWNFRCLLMLLSALPQPKNRTESPILQSKDPVARSLDSATHSREGRGGGTLKHPQVKVISNTISPHTWRRIFPLHRLIKNIC